MGPGDFFVRLKLRFLPIVTISTSVASVYSTRELSVPIETRTTPTACASGSREQRDDGDLRRLIETAAETIERADWAVAVFTESYESFALTVSSSCGDRRAARATLREAFSTYRSDLRPLPTVFPIAREHEASLALVIGVLAKGVAVATFARSTRAPSEASNKADASAQLSFAADRATHSSA